MAPSSSLEVALVLILLGRPKVLISSAEEEGVLKSQWWTGSLTEKRDVAMLGCYTVRGTQMEVLHYSVLGVYNSQFPQLLLYWMEELTHMWGLCKTPEWEGEMKTAAGSHNHYSQHLKEVELKMLPIPHDWHMEWVEERGSPGHL